MSAADGSAPPAGQAEVIVYTRLGCGYCTRLLALLRREQIAFTHHDLTSDMPRRAWLEGVTGSHTLPQVFIGGTFVGGCTDVEALHRSGKLATLLAAP